jgi:hypothetical protein
MTAYPRHCERSEAIQSVSADGFLDCFAALAMTEYVAGVLRPSSIVTEEQPK